MMIDCVSIHSPGYMKSFIWNFNYLDDGIVKVFEDQIVKVQVSRQLCSEWDWSSWVSTVKLLAVFSEFVALAGGCSVATAAHGCCHTKSHSKCWLNFPRWVFLVMRIVFIK